MRLKNLIKMIEFSGVKTSSSMDIASYAMDKFHSPLNFRNRLAEGLDVGLDKIIVAGPLDARLVMIKESDESWLALNGDRKRFLEFSNEFNELRRKSRRGLSPQGFGIVKPSRKIIQRLTQPSVYLVALHRSEIFPLPRFALGISVLASALRRDFSGQVVLDDMQLGRSISEVVEAIRSVNPDIVGISATFLQHDLLSELLTRLQLDKKNSPQVIVGGSLPVLILEKLLARWPMLWVCVGQGEKTILDITSWWRGDILKDEIAGMAYSDGRIMHRSPEVSSKSFAVFTPELDLLDATLSFNGVLNLESSRGCTNACTFCPRNHKGSWFSAENDVFDEVLIDISKTFDNHQRTARKIFLVDEEFIGSINNGSELDRIRLITDKLFSYGFRWEASTRIDQVVDPKEGPSWHSDRIKFWRFLLTKGLDRCLFGLESGVNTVLDRFNKQTSSEQNVTALRTLSACGVPMRCTYILFDQLMTFDELIDSFLFIGRRDVLLKECSGVPPGRLVEAVCDEDFISLNSLDQPLYKTIPYMLVTLELFGDAPYQKKVSNKVRAKNEGISLDLGTKAQGFVDQHIGLISGWAQRWIDRNFSFDYTLKSLQKVTNVEQRRALERIRFLLKKSAYTWLGHVLAASTGNLDIIEGLKDSIILEMNALHREEPLDCNKADIAMISCCNSLFNVLANELDNEFQIALGGLSREHRDIMLREHWRWINRTEWELLHVKND